MAVGPHLARLLLLAHRDGASFDSTVMLGRLWFKVSDAALARICLETGHTFTAAELALCRTLYADKFLELLGAREVASVDASDFEGASIVHDLNRPIPDEHKARYDAVIDGGTLEHVFNFPTALQSAMEMVRPGGRLYMVTPTNNQLGHGFYQFSPDLFFRALDESNGFKVEAMYIYEQWHSDWFAVADPRDVRKRVGAMGTSPMTLMIRAQRVEVKPLFAVPPQQSDYSAAWVAGSFKPGKGDGAKPYAPTLVGGGRVWNALPPAVRRMIESVDSGLKKAFVKPSKTLRNRKLFTRVRP